MKIKLFETRQGSYRELEDLVNEWLTENKDVNVKDMKLVSADTTRASLDSNLVLCIIYEGEENDR